MSYRENNKVKRILSYISIGLLILVSMNILIFSAPLAKAEGGSPEIHLNELGFSTEFVDTLSTTLYCPRFEQNSYWETQIILSNPSENNVNLDIKYYSENGNIINEINEEIESYNTIDFISTDHGITQEIGSLEISSDIPISGNVIYYSEYCAAAEPLQSSSSQELYCPGFYQSESWETWVCVNNIGTSSTDITFTYYNEQGTEIDSVTDSLSQHELRFFRPIDDDIEDELGSIVIESNTGNVLIGFTLKINTDRNIAYSNSLNNELENHQCSVFLTDTDNINELLFFNPETQQKNLDLTFYNYDGTQIYSLTNYELLSFETTRLIINNYIDYGCYGSVKIECDNNGINGNFGYIGSNYGFGNSIGMTSESNFYSSFKTYKEIDTYPIINMVNPTTSLIEYNLNTHNNDGGNEQNGEQEIPAGHTSGLDGGFFGSGTYIEGGCGAQQVPYPSDGHGKCYGGPTSGDGDLPTNIRSADSDDDGLPNWQEMLWICDGENSWQVGDPEDSDTDGDDLPDGWEFFKLGACAVRDSTNDNGKYGDPDSDGVTNWDEYNAGTLPKNADTDGDGMNDGYEIDCYNDNGYQDPLIYNKRYAVLIVGREVINGVRFDEFWNDLRIMYNILKNRYNYIDDTSTGFYAKNDHIAVLYAYGTDVKTGKYGTPVGNTITDYAATKSNIDTVFKQIKSQMTNNDFLFVWTFNHGGQSGTHATFGLQNGETIQDDDFATNYVGLIQNYARRYFVMQQCHSGGFIDDLSNSKTVISTACKIGELASRCDDKDTGDNYKNENENNLYHHGEYLFYLQSAYRRQDPLGNNVNADSDSNGIISAVEAFNYAWNHDSVRVLQGTEHPQFDDNNDQTGNGGPLPKGGDGTAGGLGDTTYL